MRKIPAKTAMLVLAVILALGGVTAVGYALSHQQPAPPAAADITADSPSASSPSSNVPSSDAPSSTPSASTSSPSAKASSTPSASKTATGPQELSESVPTRISIPSIKVDAEVIDVGLKSDGEIDTPDADPDQAGWFEGGHTPGAGGTSIIVGHVTWNRAPTVFFKLGELEKGDKITVKRKDGSTATFAVDRRSTFPKDEWPADKIFAASGEPELTLITCGGRYDTATHTYKSNVIVWTKLVSTKA